jgi:putative transposase
LPRGLRIDHPDVWHHVFNRGAARRAIFETDTERERFLGCCISAAGKYRLEIHGYCLLSNHYHLLVRSLDGRLSDAMRWIASRYTQSLNYDKSRDGPLFRGRFGSVLIGNETHLLEASRYIHLNPVAAGLTPKPEEWRWSSAAAYLMCIQRPKWLETETILEMFGASESSQSYSAFLDAGLECHTLRNYQMVMAEHGVRPAGSDPSKSHT